LSLAILLSRTIMHARDIFEVLNYKNCLQQT
jgi:hypothetical protein